MFCYMWWPAGFMVARLVVNNMLGCDGTQWGGGGVVLEEGECA